jgi:hypothetical protein
MPVIKTISIEVHAIDYEKLELWFEDTNIVLRRGYRLLDGEGKEIRTDLDKKTYQESFVFASLPQELQSALNTIFGYSEAAIRAKEGIS